jgi:hypothetical protein
MRVHRVRKQHILMVNVEFAFWIYRPGLVSVALRAALARDRSARRRVPCPGHGPWAELDPRNAAQRLRASKRQIYYYCVATRLRIAFACTTVCNDGLSFSPG